MIDLEQQKQMEQKAFDKQLALLIILREHLTPKTKILEIPQGYRSYMITVFDNDDSSSIFPKTHTNLVSVDEFFGMYVGYDEETDTLVCWRPK